MAHNSLIRNIRWLGHAGFLISKKKLIYIDPYKLDFPEVGDLILITDNLPQHCSPDDIKWLRKGSTVIVGPAACTDQFHGDIRTVKPGDFITVKDVKIEVVASPNSSAPDLAGGSGGVGYILHLDENYRVYHAGALKDTAGMTGILCDIGLIPIGGGNTLTPAEAAQFTSRIRPKIAIPMDWNGGKNARPMVDEYIKLCEAEVAVLKPEP